MSLSKKKWYYLVLILVVILIYSPIFYLHNYINTRNDQTDFRQHMLWAEQLKDGAQALPPYVIAHSGWQILLIFINYATGFSFAKSSFMAAIGCVLIMVLLTFSQFWPVFEKNRIPWWQRIIITLGVNIAAPVSLLWVVDQFMYFGYIGINTYHNPTIILLKPFALLQFVFASRCFYELRISRKEVFIAFIVSAIGTFVKPSFAICLLPALFIMLGWRLMQKKYLNWISVMTGQVIPVILVLAWQFLLSYFSEDGAGGIAFLPFVVMNSYSSFLFLKFILSILFPLSVTILFFKQAVKSLQYLLAWLIFILGAFFSYFMAETGARLLDGNFTWSGDITLAILFIISTLFFLDMPNKSGFRKLLLQLIWILHIISGVFYYFSCIVTNTYY